MRPPLLKMSEWLQRMTDERRATARLAYRDAEAVREGGGPLMFEMLASHLKQPWLILRIATSIMEHPGERPSGRLGTSAVLGERALADIEAQIDVVRGLQARRRDRGRRRARPGPCSTPSRRWASSNSRSS